VPNSNDFDNGVVSFAKNTKVGARQPEDLPASTACEHTSRTHCWNPANGHLKAEAVRRMAMNRIRAGRVAFNRQPFGQGPAWTNALRHDTRQKRYRDTTSILCAREVGATVDQQASVTPQNDRLTAKRSDLNFGYSTKRPDTAA
jgi:hypothetical protein